MKEKISIPVEEQELHINFSPVETGKNCEIYTTIPWAMKYLERMVNEYPNECRLIKDDKYSYTASIPFKLVKPRAPRQISEEQRKAAAERLRSMHANKNGL